MPVAAGSIAFVAYSFDNFETAAAGQPANTDQQGFAFVALADIAAGETIRFVDGRLQTSGSVTADAQVVWTNGSAALKAGTVVQVSFTGYNSTNNGWTTASANVGSVTSPAPGTYWNVNTTDSLYAVTGTAAAPGTHVATIIWGATRTNTDLNAGSVLNLNSLTPSTSNDLGMINAATANTAYASAAAARAAYTNSANWATSNDADDNVGLDWPPLTDSESTLTGHTTLTTSTPTFSFGDANGLVNAAEAAATPVTISGLGAGATAVVTFKSSANATTVTGTFSGNGTANVNLSGLSDGTISITNVAVTSSGTTTNLANPPTSNSVTLDKTAPNAPAITAVADDLAPQTGAVADGGATNDATPTVTISLSGTNAAAGDTVKLLSGGVEVASAVLTAAQVSAGSLALTPSSALSGDGAKAFTATVTDVAGNVSAASAARTLVLDTAAPAAPVITGVSDDQAPQTGGVAVGGATNDTTPTISGAAEAGSAVAVFDGATQIGAATANGSGAWSFTPTTALSQGVHSFTAYATDAAGNQGVASSAYAVTVDTAAPNAPSISGVTDDAGSVTGPVAAGASTDDTTPTVAVSLSGTNAAAGDTVRLLVGGVEVASRTLAAADITAGTVSLTSSALSGDGAKSLTATVADAAGNVSAASTARTMVLDTTAPAAPSITGVTDDAGSLTGPVAAGASSDDSTPTVAISLSGTGAAVGDTVALLVGGAQVASKVLAAADITAGSVSVTSSALSGDGGKSLTATVTDAAGNVSAASDGRAFVLDTVAPAAPSINGLTDDQAPQTGNVASGGATNDTRPTLSGTAEANSTVSVFDGANLLGTVAADGAGAWSFTPSAALSQGGHSLTARATDAAGNQGPASAAYAVTVDTAAPNAPSVASVTDDQAPRTGTVPPGGSTNDATPAVTVSLSGTNAAAGDTVTLLSNGASVGAAVLTAAQVSAGSVTIASSALGAAGAKALTATVTDAAGNASAASAVFAVTLDTAAPAAPTVTGVTDDFGSVTGPVAAGGATDDATPTVAISLAGTNAVAGDTVELLAGGTQVASITLTAAQISAGTVSLTSSALSGDGAKSLTATVTDAAGNVSAASAAFGITLDTTPPTEASTIRLVSDTGASATDGVTSDPALAGTVSGGASGLTVTVLDGMTIVGTATTGAGGAWSFANAAAAEGAHSYTAAVTDAAGNRGTPSAALAVTLDKTAPTTTATIALASDTGASATDGVTSNPALSGTGPANTTIVVKDGGTVIGTATANASGAWSLTPAGAAAADGPHAYTAQVSDLAGNLGPAGATSPASVTVDTSAPAAPTVAAVADNVGATQGNLAGGASTDDNTLTLSGTAEAGATVKVFNGSTLVGTTTATPGGAWTLTTAALPDGGVSLTATATDAAGNAGGASAAFTATVDTVAPNAPSITGVADDQAPQTGAVADGASSNDTTPAVAVSLSGTNAVAGDTVRLLANGAQVASKVLAAADIAAGSVTLVSSALSGDGSKSLAATVTDAAGNVSGLSAARTMVLDTTAPTETTTVRLVSDTGASATDGVTSDPALSGTVSNAAAGVTVTVFDGAAAIGTATTGANGVWAFTPGGAAAADGGHSYTARVTDAAGNLGPAGATSPAGTTLDTAAPTETTTVRLVSDTGASATDGVTSDPALTGTVSNGAGGVLVTVLDGATVLGTAITGAGGVWSFTPTGTGASSGAHSYAAAVTDAAGNRGAAAGTSPATTTLDTTAPNQPSITGVADDQAPRTGAVAAGGSTDDTTPAVTVSLSGTGAAAGDTVTLLSNGVPVGTAVLTAAQVSAGAVAITSSSLGADGAKALTATVTDAAGNVSAASGAFNVALDTAAPAAPVVTAVSDDVGAAQGNLASGAATDDNALSLAGTAEANSTVAVFNGSTQLGTTTADGSGAWSFTTPALADGSVLLTARATDAAGNQGGASTAFAATVDTAAPAVTSIAASGAGITAGAGALNAGKVVTLTVTAAEALFVAGTPTLALSSGGTAAYQGGSGTASLVFTYTVAAGENTADLAVSALNLPSGASVRDAAGNALTFNAVAVGNPAGTLVIDTTAPAAAPAITGVTDDAGSVTGPLLSGASTDDTTPTATLSLSGTGAAAGDTLALFAGGTQVASKVLAAADIAAGSVSLSASALAGDGAKALTATVTDAAGNASAASAAFNIVLDTAAPAAPVIGGAADDQAPATGALADGASTNDTTPTLSGTAEAGATVAVFDGGTRIGTATANGSGAWSFTPGTALGQGAHSFTAQAADAAGNQGQVSAAFGLTVDTAAPAAAPAISGVGDDAGSVTGPIADGGVTDDATPTVALSLSGTGAVAGDTVALFADGVPVASKVLTAADVSTGIVSLTASPLSGDGSKSLTATLTDAAGNASGVSATRSIVLDTAAPAAPAIGGAADDVAPNTGAVADNGETNDAAPTLSGTAEAGATVSVYDGATLLGSATADGSGAWSFTPGTALADGAHSLTAEAADAAGNRGGASAAFAFTVDTAAPANTTTLALSADTGASSSDGATSNPALSGTVSGATAGLTVTILEGTAVVGTAAIGAGGAWTFANAAATDGAHTYTAVVTDAAGNRGPASGALSLTLDKSAPAAPSIGAVADDAGAAQGNLAGGASTDDNTPTLSGTAEAGATVGVYNGSTLVGTATANGTGAWTLTTSALPDGAVSLTARATDAAGNQSPASAAFNATVDTAAPAAPVIGTVTDDRAPQTGALSSGDLTDDAALTLAGTAEANSTVAVYNNSTTLVGTATADSSGAWTLTTSPLTGGAVSLTARATDAAGNEGGASTAFAATVDTGAPDVFSVAASGPGITAGDGVLNAGKTVTVTVNASEAVTVTGAPTLSLNSGGTATYQSGSGTAALVFTYTVAAGEDTADLAVTALNLPSGASIRDASGNDIGFDAVAVGNPAGTLVIDTTAPTETSTLALARDTGASATDGVTSDPALTGAVSSGASGVLVTILDGSAVVGTATTGAGGAWSFANTGAAEGAHTYTASVTDAAGNLGLAGNALSVALDTTAPTDAATIALAADTGTAGDGVSSSPALAGTGPANTTIVIKDGAAVVGTVSTDASGAWTFANASAAEGAHAYTAQVADTAGNLGPAAATAPATTTLDTTAPSAPAVAGVTDDAGALTGAVAAGGATDDTTPTVAVSLAGTGAAAGDTVKLFADGTEVASRALTAADVAAGSVDLTSSAMSGDGAKSLTATVTDAAGNASAASAARSLVLDTTPPAAPSIGVATDDAGPVQGNLASGASTDDATPTITGTAEAGATITVFDGAARLGATTADASGNWSFTPGAALADFAHGFTARATDAAGNQGLASAAFNVTVDTAAPAAPTIAGVTDDAGAVTGAVAAGGSTDDATPTVEISLAGTSAAAGDTVRLLAGGTQVASAVLTAADIAAGTVALTSSALGADGAKSLTATVTDAAGNASAASGAFGITLDTTAPADTSTIALASDTGYSASDGVTSDPDLAGAVSSGAAGVLVTVLDGSTVVGTATTGAGGAWSFANAAAAEGAHTYTARVTDEAGNRGPASAPLAVTLDKTAPADTATLALASDTGVSTTDGVTSDPALTGTGPANATIVVKDGATVLGSATADANGVWSFTPTGAAAGDGAHSYTAQVADAAGNLGPASNALAATLDGTAPSVPAIGAITDDAGGVTGAVASGASTDDATPTVQVLLSGTGAAAGDTVTVSGTSVVLTAADVSAGSVSLDVPLGADGTKILSVTVTDAAGNVSTASAARSLVLDTVAPGAPSPLALASDTGVSATDGVTSDPTVTGKAEAGATVTLRVGTTVVGTGTADGSGNFFITPTGLAQGPNTVTATATDAAGNAGPAASLAFTLDTAAPAAPSIGGVADDQAPVSGAVADGDVTDDATPTISGTAEAGSTVAVFDGTTRLGTATADGSGAWSFTPGTALVQGPHSLTARATDAAGNEGAASAAFAFTVDTGAPDAPSIASVTDDQAPQTGNVAAGGATNDTTPLVRVSLAGTGAAAGDAAQVLVDGAAAGGATLTAADITAGFVDVTAALSGDGAKALTARVVDAVGNASPASAAFNVVLDTVAPTASPTIGLLSDTGTPGDGITSDPTLTGTGPANGTIVIKDGATVLGTAVADSSGAWTFTPAGAGAADGTHAYTAQVADDAGNLGPAAATAPATVTVDTQAPAETATIGLASDTGASATDGVTSDPALAGTVSNGAAGLTVTVFDNGTAIGTATTGAGGAWTFANAGAADGAHSYTAAVTDAAGNQGQASAALAATLDTATPNAPSITGVTDDAGAVTGAVAAGGTTDDTTPTVAISLAGTGAAAGDTVRLLADGAAVGSVTLAATDIAAGSASVTPSAPLSGDGAKALTAQVVDAAGNVSLASAPRGIVLDTAAPAAPTIDGVLDDQTPVSGAVADGGATDDTAPTLSGTAEAGATVTVYDGATALGSATADGSGAWSFTPSAPLREGAHSLTARAADAAGNGGPASAAYAVTVDTALPGAPSIAGVTDDAGAVTGPVAAGGSTDDTTPAVAVSLTGTGAAAGDTVELFADGTQVGTATLTAADVGAGSVTVVSAALSGDGAKAFTATLTDAAGNVSAASGAYNTVLDTAAPAAPAIGGVSDDAAPAIGAVADGGATNDATPAISGTAEVGATVAVFDGAAQLGATTADASGNWSFTPGAALADGAHAFTARATDAAGNQGPASAAFTVTVDTAAPAVPSITAVADDAGPAQGALSSGDTTDDATLTLSGTAEAGAAIEVLNGTAVVATATADGAGDWSATTAALPNGPVSLTARAADAAGNLGAASAAFAATVDTGAPNAPAIAGVTDDAGSVTGALASGGATDDTTPTVAISLSGTGAAVGDTVALFANGAQVASAVLAGADIGAGAVSLAASALAGDGAKALTATVTNAAGNASPASAAFNIVLDTTAPTAPAIDAVADDAGTVQGDLVDGGATDDTTPTATVRFGGAGAVAGDTVKLLANGVEVASKVLSAADIGAGTVSFAASALAGDGAKALMATLVDQAGNASGASGAFTVVLDTAAPTETTTVRLVSDTGSSPTDGVTSNPALIGAVSNGAAGLAVTVSDGTTVLGTATTGPGGVWTFTPPVTDGAHSYTAAVTDAAGNSGPANATAPATTTVDTTAPAAAPAIGAVTDDAGPVTGTVAAGGATDDTTPTVQVSLSGTGAATGDTVRLLADNVVVGTAVLAAADIAAGSVGVTPSTPLSGDGAKALAAQLVDAAGNASAVSATRAIVLDTTAPAAPGIAGLSDDQAPVIATVQNGGATNDATPTAEVTFGAGTVTAGDTVKLFADGVEVGSKVLTAAEASAGTASVASAALATDGTKAFTATVNDAAGNASAASPAFTATLDTAAPAAPVVTAVSDNVGAAQGNLANGATTDDNTLSLAGTAEAGSTVAVFNGSTQFGTATADGSGAWSFTAAALPDGAVSLTARAADAAGNQGPASAAFTATIDTGAAGAPAITAVVDDAGAVTGTLAAGAATDDATPTVQVSLSGTGAAAGDTLAVFANGAQVASKALSASEIAAGSASLASAPLSGDGVKALTAVITDAAGNASAASAAFGIVLDTAAPAAPAGLELANDTGAAGDGLSSDPTVRGVAEAGSTVVLRDGTTVLGTAVADPVTGAFSIAPTGLAQGAHAVTATATDAAGNTGPSTGLAFSLDTVAPTAISVVATGPGIVGGNGALSAGKTVTLTVNADEALSVAGTPTLALNNGGTAAYAGGSGTAALAFTYTVAAGEDAADLAVTALDLPSGSAVTDAAGNALAFNAGFVGSPAGTLVIDTTAPTEAATIGLVADTGVSATDRVTSDPALFGAVSGGAAGLTVSILDGAAVVGTATTGAGGAWSFANAAAVDGAHSYTARVADAAGNLGPASAALAVTLDRTAPIAVLAITGVTDDAGAVTGAVAAGGATDDTTPTVALSLLGTGAAVGDTLALLADGARVASKVLTAADIIAAAVSLTSSALSGDASKSLTAILTDAAGNASAVSSVRTIVLDTTAPGAPAIAGVSDDQAPQTGPVASGGATNDTTPTISGRAEADGTVAVFDGTKLLGTARADVTGAWSFAPGTALTQGTYTLTAKATDAAGNQGAASAAYTLTVDTAAPTETTTIRLVSDTGNSATDGLTSETALTGTVSTNTAGVLVTILDGAAVVGTATTAAGGAWTFLNAGAADGNHSYTAAVTDAAGNRGPAATLAATLDRQPPAETSTVRLASDTGPSPTDGVTSNPALTGAVSSGEAGVLVTIFDGAVAVGTVSTGAGGAWTFANTAAADGAHSYAAAVTDEAGNRGSASAPPLAVTLDTVPPTAAPTTTVELAADTGTPGDRATANPALTGAVSSGEAGVAVTVFEGAAAVGTTITGAGGAWRFANLGAADAYGLHTYTAAAVDLAGNRGPASAPLAITIDRSGDDDLSFLGTAGPESIAGEAGSDRITGLGGDDTLRGDGTAGNAAGSDTLDGGAGDDVLLGGGGDDALAGRAGDDLINGGPGTDTADYSSGRRSDFILDSTKPFFMGDSVVLIDTRSGGEGRDTLTGVEFFTFADGTVSVAELVNSQPRSPDADPGQRPPATVFGTGGDDRLALRAGGDTFDGLGGRDWLDLTAEGSRESVITVLPDGTVDLAHGDGRTDELYSVEEIRFLDGRVVFDPADIVAQVARLYAAALDRLPDQGGFNFWVRGLQVGFSLSAIADGFLDSREFQTRFGDATAGSGGFVDRLYFNVLGRLGDADGRAFWVDALERGTSRADVLVAFSESPENKAGTTPLIQTGIWDRSETAAEVARLYDTVLGRLPDALGLAYWKAGLDTGAIDLAQAAGEFTGSAEFRATYGALSNRDFANALYVNTLDRAAEAEGLAFWTDRLDVSVARSAVVLAFSESQEHIALTADAIQSEKPGEFGILFA